MESAPKKVKPAVFKLACAGKFWYKFGYGADDARVRLSRQLRVKTEEIEILEGGKPQ